MPKSTRWGGVSNAAESKPGAAPVPPQDVPGDAVELDAPAAEPVAVPAAVEGAGTATEATEPDEAPEDADEGEDAEQAEPEAEGDGESHEPELFEF